LRFNVLQEIDRPNRIAIVEAWRDPVALDADAKAASTLRFREELKAIETAPYDDRINNALAAKKGENAAEPGMIYVVTHVDVIPAGKDDCIAVLLPTTDDASPTIRPFLSHRGPPACNCPSLHDINWSV
jgi:hypothetical protein